MEAHSSVGTMGSGPSRIRTGHSTNKDLQSAEAHVSGSGGVKA